MKGSSMQHWHYSNPQIIPFPTLLYGHKRSYIPFSFHLLYFCHIFTLLQLHLYSVSEKSSPLKLFAIFSLVMNHV